MPYLVNLCHFHLFDSLFEFFRLDIVLQLSALDFRFNGCIRRMDWRSSYWSEFHIFGWYFRWLCLQWRIIGGNRDTRRGLGCRVWRFLGWSWIRAQSFQNTLVLFPRFRRGIIRRSLAPEFLKGRIQKGVRLTRHQSAGWNIRVRKGAWEFLDRGCIRHFDFNRSFSNSYSRLVVHHFRLV